LIPLNAPLSYGRIRRQVEDQCQEACAASRIPLKIARGFAFAGPRLPENAGFALVDFLKDAAAAKKIRVKGSGNPVRSYMYAGDMAVWLWKILLTSSESETFNVGSEEGFKLKDVAALIASISHTQVEILDLESQGAAQNNVYFPLNSKGLLKLKLAFPINLTQLLRQKVCLAKK
jgi:dTDP-glucose 4,6-dehydratase